MAYLWSKVKILPRLPLLGAIFVYQKTLSPDHGLFRGLFPHGYCKYYPTCSRYGFRAIARFGAIRGTWMALHRIVRCNPSSLGGIDEVPEQFYFIKRIKEQHV